MQLLTVQSSGALVAPRCLQMAAEARDQVAKDGDLLIVARLRETKIEHEIDLVNSALQRRLAADDEAAVNVAVVTKPPPPPHRHHHPQLRWS